MLLIHNLSGLLLGLAGAFVGLVVALSSRHLSLGLLFIGLVWATFGWRRTDPATKQKRPYPSVYFIPLAFVGVALIPLAVPLFLIERVARSLPRDPRAERLDLAERSLRAIATGGDEWLSTAVRERLEGGGDAAGPIGDWHIYARVDRDAVLVIVQVPDLKRHDDAARVQLLGLIDDAVSDQDRLKGRQRYVAVKGRVAYGAIRTPDGADRVGAAVSERSLYDFYGPAAPTTGRR